MSVVLNVLPINVMAESGSGSPILRSPSSPETHGNVVETQNVFNGCKVTLYQDGYTLVDKKDDAPGCILQANTNMPDSMRAKIKK